MAVDYESGIGISTIWQSSTDGTNYTDRIVIPVIQGASAGNRVIFNGNGETIAYSTSVSADRAAIYLNGADYITINDFVINTDGNTYGWGIQMMNQADYNQITNNTIISSISITTSNQSGIIANGSATSATTGGNGANNTLISGNTIIGGYYPIVLYSTSSASSAGNQVIDNTIVDSYMYNVYLAYQTGATVGKNDISRVNRSNGSTFYGVYVSTGVSTAMIEKNRIHNTFTLNPASTSAAYGVYLSGADAAAGQENKVVNNLIYNFDGGGIEYGFYNSSSDGAQYYHNTVSLDNTSTTATTAAYAFYQTTTATRLEIKNNIFSVTRGGTGLRRALNFNSTGASSSTFSATNNVLYVNSATGTNEIAYVNPTIYANLSAWQTAGFGAGSVDIIPAFTSPATGDFTPTNIGIDNIGAALGVAEDILDASRDMSQPDAGAYEFTGVPYCAAPVSLATANATATTATLNWSLPGGGTGDFNVFTGTVGFDPTAATPVPVTGNSYAFTAGTASPDGYEFYVQQICASSTSVLAGPFKFFTVPANDDCANAIAVPVSAFGNCTPVTGNIG
ncbi:MAG: hypothetical protein EOP51_27860, partial [Sphingobacteriales bacterium]